MPAISLLTGGGAQLLYTLPDLQAHAVPAGVLVAGFGVDLGRRWRRHDARQNNRLLLQLQRRGPLGPTVAGQPQLAVRAPRQADCRSVDRAVPHGRHRGRVARSGRRGCRGAGAGQRLRERVLCAGRHPRAFQAAARRAGGAPSLGAIVVPRGLGRERSRQIGQRHIDQDGGGAVRDAEEDHGGAGADGHLCAAQRRCERDCLQPILVAWLRSSHRCRCAVRAATTG